jgi:hypothetical protein
MKAEVLAPDKGNNRRDFHFEADVKRIHVYPTGWPEYETSWLSIVEGEGGVIKVIWHGKFVGEVKTVYVLGEEPLNANQPFSNEGKP